MKNPTLKKSVLTMLQTIKYVTCLYFVFHGIFLVTLFIKNDFSNNLKLTALQVVIYFVSFLMFLFIQTIVSYYNKVSKQVKSLIVVQFIVNNLWFFFSFFSFKINPFSITWTIILITIISFFLAAVNILILTAIINDFNDINEEEFLSKIFGEVEIDNNITKEVAIENKNYITKQKIKMFVLMVLLVNQFTYRNKWVLLAFFIIMFIMILLVSFRNIKENINLKPSIFLLALTLILFILIYIFFILTIPIESINQEDWRLFAALIPIPLLLHYYSLGKQFDIIILKDKLD